MGKRTRDRLSVKAVDGKKTPGYYADGGGLYLQVSPSGSKSWIFRYTRGINPKNGKPKQNEMGLGPLLEISLARARKAAELQRELLALGKDPRRGAKVAERGGGRREGQIEAVP